MKEIEQLENTINNISILNDLLNEKLCLLDQKNNEYATKRRSNEII